MASESSRNPREREVLLKIHQINRAICVETNMDRLLDVIMEQAITFTRAERGFLILKDEETGNPVVRVAKNIAREVIDHPMFKVSRGIMERTWESNQPVILESAKDDIEFKQRQTVINMGLASVACIPLKWGGTTVGVLYLDNRFRKGLFDAGDVLLLELFADSAASAIALARQRSALEERRKEVDLLKAQLHHATLQVEALRAKAAGSSDPPSRNPTTGESPSGKEPFAGDSNLSPP